MKTVHTPRLFVLFLLCISLILVACGGSEEAPAATEAPPPAATDTAVPAPTAQTSETSQEAAAVDPAVNRATTMMTTNGKPTPAPFAGLGGKDDETAPAAPAPTNTPAPTIAPSAGVVGIQVENLSSAPVCFAFVTTPDSDSWGNDLLGENGIIEIGANTVFELPAGTYDLRLDDCFGKVMAVELGLAVNALTNVAVQDVPLPQAGDAPVTMLNDVPEVNACYVYIAPNTSSEWGDDWLGTGLVVPTDYQIVFNVPSGTYDMQALDCNFQLINETYGVELTSAGYVWLLSGAEATATSQATLEIINEGSQPICYLQISLSTATEWGPDWLGSEQMIDPGTSLTFELSADTYDARALNCNEEVLAEQYGIAIEGNITWNIP